MTVSEGLSRFLADSGLDRRSYGARRFVVSLGPLKLPFPNPRYLRFHDLHHVVLGARAGFWGEVQVSAFEIRSGTPTALIAFLCVASLMLGACIRPVTVWRWLRQYARASNLYLESSYERLLEHDLGELRRRLGLVDSPDVEEIRVSYGQRRREDRQGRQVRKSL